MSCARKIRMLSRPGEVIKLFGRTSRRAMEIEAARAEIIKTAKNLPRLLGNLDKYALELREQRMRLDASPTMFGCMPSCSSWPPMSGTTMSMSSARLMRTGWLLIRSCWMSASLCGSSEQRRKAEPDARQLQRSRTPARRGRPPRFHRSGFRTGLFAISVALRGEG